MFQRESAQIIALRALGWLAGDEERLGTFMTQTGIALDDLCDAADEPTLLAAIVDHILADERMVLDFAAEAGLPPRTLSEIRMALPGGDVPDWT